jgi:hypothetical protein
LKLKTFFISCLFALVFTFPTTNVHGETITKQILEEYYQEFQNEYVSFGKTFEEFAANYQSHPTTYGLSEEDKLHDYLKSVNEQHVQQEAEKYSRLPPLWSYDIGNSLEILTFEKVPIYHKYDLLDTVQPGDVIFERKRADIGAVYLHHVMIVEGIFEETHIINGKAETFKYIRTIEATDSGGVGYGVLDDERYDYINATILRVSDATIEQKKAAIKFTHSQLGKSYKIDLDNRNRSSNREEWYCSKLVWVAYMNATPDGRINETTHHDSPNFQGIDLEGDAGVIQFGVTPYEIKKSDRVEAVPLFFADYKNYMENVTWTNTGSNSTGEDFIFSRDSIAYSLQNNYHFVAIDKNNGRPFTSTRLTFGRNWSGVLQVEFDFFTQFLLTDEARRIYSDIGTPIIPIGIKDHQVPNYVMNWINRYTQCSLDIVYSTDITTESNHLRFNPSYTEIIQKAHPLHQYMVNQVVHTPPPFTQQRFDYTENLTIYEHYDLARPNPVNADISYNRTSLSWYYFYNDFYALVRLENGTYRYATYLRFHGSFSNAASERNGYGMNHDYTMTDEAKRIYGNYFYRIGVNQTVDYAIDWLNQYTKETTLIVHSRNIENDVWRLNNGTAVVTKGFNDRGQFVNRIL